MFAKMEGLVFRSTGSWYDVQLNNGSRVQCRLKGVLRLDELKNTNPIAVGDYVLLEKSEEGDMMITEVRERKNYIIRQSPRQVKSKHIIAANLDQAVLLATLSHPRTSSGFIDRFLVTAEAYQVPAVLVFNKQDMLDTKGKMKQQALANIYTRIGYRVLFASAETGEGIDDVKEMLKDKVSLIAGHSGVGKSSIVNRIEPDLNLRVNNISKISGKGMHTTTFAEMHNLSFGGKIIDTPGIREFGLYHITPEELFHYFPEFRALMNQCKFNNCLHENEPDCAVKAAFVNNEIPESRYVNYLNMLEDLKENYIHWDL
jgi:ribosome biogenesis GTPase